MKLKARRPGVQPACLGGGAGAPRARLLVQARYVWGGCPWAGGEPQLRCDRRRVRKGRWWRLTSASPERGLPERLVTRRCGPSRKWRGDPRSSLRRQYCPHCTCVLGPELQSITRGLPGAAILTPIRRPAVRRPHCLGRELNVS